jgi:hypothetical protein
VLALWVVALPRVAAAQAEPPRLQAKIEADRVEVGQPFTIQLEVTMSPGSPDASDPRVTLPAGMLASSPSIASQTQISFVNGHMTRSSGITATWQVTPSREGTFTVGPPSVAWNGRRLSTNTVRITVVAPGAAPRPGTGRRGRQNPFDPFGMFPGFSNLFETPFDAPQAPVSEDPELAVEMPPDPNLFLRATVNPGSAVVGEQVTLNVYLYVREGFREPAGVDEHDGSAPDFLAHDLLNPATPPEPKHVIINGARWQVLTQTKKALFPLKAGDLTIGPTTMTLRLARGAPAKRETQSLTVHVTEPPTAGRPVGYQIGDVGTYTMAASVEPRTAEVGGAVSVVATLTGTGNVPSALHVPMKSSLEWLEPQVRDNIDVEGGKLKGSRTFTYVVRPRAAGEIDLGELTLAFWDPARRAYDVARAPLGKIRVAASQNAAMNADPPAPHDPWAAMGQLRDHLGSHKSAGRPLTDRPLYWIGVFGAPFAVVLTAAGVRRARTLREQWKQRQKSPARTADEALAVARAAGKRGDVGAMAGALDRALYAAIERATGIRARGLLLDELPPALVARGIEDDLSRGVRDLLAAVQTARFTPNAGAASDLVARTTDTVRKLGRMSVKGA